jgi:uncharacterized membrane protein
MHEPTKPAREPEGLPRWVVMVLIGLVVFGEMPSLATLVGTGLIVAGAILVSR